MKYIYLIKIGELNLKGNNKNIFQNTLSQNIKKQLGTGADIKIISREGRFFVEFKGDDNPDTRNLLEKTLSSVFGLIGFARAIKTDKDIESVKKAAYKIAEISIKDTQDYTFKIEARRSDKDYPYTSYEIACLAGAYLVEKSGGNLKVKLKNPDFTVNIEIRDYAYIYSQTIKGPGGLPAGAAGKGLLMLSGGIDSPAAGYLMARRGLRIDAVHFYTYPYTSEQSREKVIKIAEKLSEFLPDFKLYIVPFTDIQLYIKKNARGDEVTLLSRAAMMEISHITAKKIKANCIITGECLSQVASQTAESMRFTGSLTDYPVLRPLCGFDKEEIISLAQKIGTYEISILPYNDCCSVFAPDRPNIKPLFTKIKQCYENLQMGELIHKAADEIETVIIKKTG